MKLHPARHRRRSPAANSRARSWKATLGSWYPGRLIFVAVLVGTGLLLLYRHINVPALHAYAAQLNGGVAFALLVALPLVGFPANVLQFTAGIRFGFILGMTLVTFSIFLQLLASYAIVHARPGLFARRLARVRKRIPPVAHGTVCLFTLLLPGVPYFIQNYTLALIGVPFRTYLTHCLPLNILRAVIAVGLGQQSGHFSHTSLMVLGVYWLLVLTASWWTYRKLRQQLADQPAGPGLLPAKAASSG